MGLFRFAWLLAIVPTSVLLTISFFVLFTLRKAEQNSLKIFGYVVIVLLWISAALILGGAIYAVVTGRQPIIPMMPDMMRGKIGNPMMQYKMMQR